MLQAAWLVIVLETTDHDYEDGKLFINSTIEKQVAAKASEY